LPEPESLYTICYTSGTTGDSKGVKISHENIVAMVSGVNYEKVFSNKDVCYSYLPLSHMAERAFLGNSYAKGTKIGFFSGSLTRIREDLKLLRPTIFSTVPRILQKHAAAIKQEFNNQGALMKKVIDYAIKTKLHYLKRNFYTHELFDFFIFNQVRESLGGRVKLITTGAAPIEPETLDFLKVCFCCPIIEGYG